MTRFSLPRAYRTARQLLSEARYIRRTSPRTIPDEVAGLIEQVHELRHEIAIERRRRARAGGEVGA